MKTFGLQFLFACLVLPTTLVRAERCDLDIELVWNEEPYSLNHEQNGVRLTRCDYLLSQFAFQRSDGTWLEANKSLLGLISHQTGRTQLSLGQIPLGTYQALRFVVGLDSETNHSDPNLYPPEHALNPQLNNLHWTWQTGYIFCALEGYTEDDLGFLYHLGNDANATTVTLPLELDTRSLSTVSLQLDLATILANPELNIRETTSTHSREEDPVARTIATALQKSFRVAHVKKGVFHHQSENKSIEINPKATAQPRIQSHFPQPAFPSDNPLTEEGIALGKQLFFDPILSSKKNLSCSSCHQPEAAFSDAGKAFSAGHLGQKGTRNSMPLFNLAWHKEMFWDGRAKTLREQVLHPIEHSEELALPLEKALARLNASEHYPPQFQAVFSSSKINSEHLAKALEQYLLSLISQESRFDQAMRGEVQFTVQEKRGFELFVTEHDPANGLKGADCFHCHGGSLFTNHTFANNGLTNNLKDLGREIVTGKSSDRGKFKVPSLRNLTLTAPYMHDGRFDSLEQVIEHYNSGVQRSSTLDPNLAKHPTTGLNLTSDDKAALLAFLHTLTDTNLTQNTAN